MSLELSTRSLLQGRQTILCENSKLRVSIITKNTLIIIGKMKNEFNSILFNKSWELQCIKISNYGNSFIEEDLEWGSNGRWMKLWHGSGEKDKKFSRMYIFGGLISIKSYSSKFGNRETELKNNKYFYFSRSRSTSQERDIGQG